MIFSIGPSYFSLDSVCLHIKILKVIDIHYLNQCMSKFGLLLLIMLTTDLQMVDYKRCYTDRE